MKTRLILISNASALDSLLGNNSEDIQDHLIYLEIVQANPDDSLQEDIHTLLSESHKNRLLRMKADEEATESLRITL